MIDVSHYLIARPSIAARPSLGALGFDNVDDLAARVASRVATSVTDKVTSDLSKAVDRGVERITGAAGAGLDRFLDSAAGKALADKLETKASTIAVNVVKKRQVELALLGVAGLAFFMGGSNLANRMGPRGTRVAFAVGAVALGLVASGVFAPADDATPSAPPLPLPARRTPR